MTPREGVYSNHQSTVITGGWPNRHITFIVVKKSLIYSLSCSIYGICEGRGLVENVIWRGGWLKTSEYHYMGGGGLKLLKKRHMIFERFLN